MLLVHFVLAMVQKGHSRSIQLPHLPVPVRDTSGIHAQLHEGRQPSTICIFQHNPKLVRSRRLCYEPWKTIILQHLCESDPFPGNVPEHPTLDRFRSRCVVDVAENVQHAALQPRGRRISRKYVEGSVKPLCSQMNPGVILAGEEMEIQRVDIFALRSSEKLSPR